MRRKTEARCETFLDANLRALVRLLVGRMSGEECYRGAWRFARLVPFGARLRSWNFGRHWPSPVCTINTRNLETLHGSLAPRAAGRARCCLLYTTCRHGMAGMRVHGCGSSGRRQQATEWARASENDGRLRGPLAARPDKGMRQRTRFACRNSYCG
jgi:hypothetical protein